MLRNIIFQKKRPIYLKLVRNFLSDEFKCSKTWNELITSNVCNDLKTIAKINDKYLIDIHYLIKPISIDFDRGVDNILDVMRRLRASASTTNSSELNNHALIRFFLENDVSYIYHILQNRLEYGVFLDEYTSCWLLNQLIVSKEYEVAVNILLNFIFPDKLDNKLTKALALYALYKKVSTVDPVTKPDTPEQNSVSSEQKKVRVKYIRNEYSDTTEEKNFRSCLGSALIHITKETNNKILLNLQFIGLVLLGKYEHSIKILNASTDLFYKEILELGMHIIQTDNANNTKIVFSLKNTFNNIKQQNLFETDLREFLNYSVKDLEPCAIEAQTQIYKDWLVVLQNKLNLVKKNIDRDTRMENVQKMFLKMQEREKQLWFFDKEDSIDLQIENLKQTYPKLWFGKKKKPKLIDNEYVPPEILRRA